MTINPLFLVLLAAGVVLVLGILVYNWMQARRLRDRGAAARVDGDAKAARDAGHGPLADEGLDPALPDFRLAHAHAPERRVGVERIRG